MHDVAQQSPRRSKRTHQSHAAGGMPATPQRSRLQDATQSEDSSQQHIRTAGKQRNTPGRQRGAGNDASYQMPNYDGSASPIPHAATATTTATQYQKSNGLDPLKTPIKQAYAGPTFHASPAASALPMPKFLSRSGPSDVPPSHLRNLMDAEGYLSSSPSNSPSRPKPLEPVAREESPLDFFFKAQKAEQSSQKAKASPLATHAVLRPDSSNARAAKHDALSAPGQRPGGGKEMFMMELDGSGEPGHGFANDGSSDINEAALDEQQRMAKTQALRRMLLGRNDSPLTPQQRTTDVHQWSNTPSTDFHLFQGSGGPSQGLAPSGQVGYGGYGAPGGYDGHGYQSVHKMPVHAMPPAGGSHDAAGGGRGHGGAQSSKMHAADVKSMEDNLRKLLKLDGLP